MVPRVEVVVHSGLERGKRAGCESGSLIIGSASDCDLVLDDKTVSARHCELTLSPDGIHLRDLGSKNGVRVGPTWLKEGFVDPGTVLTVGETEVLLESPGATRVTLSTQSRFGPLLGQSVAMRALFARLPDLAPAAAPVLVEGETGTGKGLLVRALFEASKRKGELCTFDCPEAEAAALERALAAAPADGALLFDEVGELPAAAQRSLSRALESRGPAKLFFTSGKSLRSEVTAGRFRPELYHRISGLRVVLPPLRQRMEDLPLLVDAALAALQSPLQWASLPESTQVMLQLHRWPGNVREVKNVVERLVAQDGPILEHSELPFDGGDPDAFLPLSEARDRAQDRFERAYLQVLLKRSRGGVSEGARIAKVSRQFLQRLMKKHGHR